MVAAEAPLPCRSVVDGDGADSPFAVTWLSATGDDRDQLDLWCRTVGPIVIAPDAMTTEPSPSDLAVVTWNVHVDGADLGAFIGMLRSGGLTHAEPVKDFVLLLQEAFRASAALAALWDAAPVPPGVDERSQEEQRDVVAVAKSAGLHAYYVPSMRNGRGPGGAVAEDRGNAILSTRPLSDFTAIELPFARHRRVAIGATIQMAEGPVRLVSGHVDATAGPGRLWVFSSGIRANQARRIIDAVAGHSRVVTGVDLNSWAEGPSERAVVAFREAFPQTGALTAVSTFRLPLRLDYLFVRLPGGTPVDAQRVEDRFGSDHHALIARVRE
jgi:endonuclease/exonuclease/phosphatase family metal-dependent hydrolase